MLIESAGGNLHDATRQGLFLFLAAATLEGRALPDELLRRIRLTARN